MYSCHSRVFLFNPNNDSKLYEMKTHLHKLPEGFIVTSDEEIKQGDLKYTPFDDIIKIHKQEGQYYDTHESKIIAQQHQITFSDDITEEKLREIGWVDVQKLNENANGYAVFGKPIGEKYLAFKEGYNQGFQKAQELLSERRFTEGDLRKAIAMAKKANTPDGLIDMDSWISNGYEGAEPAHSEEEIIKSLSQPKSWEVEIEIDFCPQALPKDRYTPKLTNGKITITRIL